MVEVTLTVSLYGGNALAILVLLVVFHPSYGIMEERLIANVTS